MKKLTDKEFLKELKILWDSNSKIRFKIRTILEKYFGNNERTYKILNKLNNLK